MSVLDILKSIGEKIGENINSMIQTIKESDFIQFLLNSSLERYNFFIYLIAFAILIIFTVLFFYYSRHRMKFSMETFLFTFSIIIPLSLLYYFVSPYASKLGQGAPGNEKNIMMICVGLTIFALAITYISTKLSYRNLLMAGYVAIFLFALMVIVGLAIIFLMFSMYLKQSKGWLGLLVHFIFYIPCLLIDFVQYIKGEIKSTANLIYVLFIIEILLVLTYIYLPKLVSKVLKQNGIAVLPDSRFLNKEYVLTSNEIMKLPKAKTDDPTNYRQNFAVSMWIYIDPQSNSYNAYSKETNIFNMDDKKPQLVYTNNMSNDDEKDKLGIYFGEDKHLIKNKGQRWTNVVINYASTTVDIFIDGNLERTFNLTTPPQYITTGKVVLGSNNGLDGAICNIMYYDRALLKTEIVNMYNLLMFSNPPLNE
jgi:hypothetical protein